MEHKSNNSLLKWILGVIILLIIISLFKNKNSDKKDKVYDNSTKSYDTSNFDNYKDNSIGLTNIITDDMKKRGSVFCLGEAYAVVEIESLNMSTQGLLNDKMSDTIIEVGESTYKLCINNLWRKEPYSKRINEKIYTLGQVAFCMGFRSGGKDLADATYYQILQMGGDVSNYNPNENWNDYYYKCLENKIWEIIIPPETKQKNTSQNCNIKGNVRYNDGEKIYHLPGCSHYNDTVINRAYGERYFCSEQEAVNAGWRKCIDY